MKKGLLIIAMCLITIPMMAQSKSNKGYVDLGLPSGTLWKATNETGLYDFFDASNKHQDALPTGVQWSELRDYCTWTWTSKGYKVIGGNGNFIILPAEGFRHPDHQGTVGVGQIGAYWSSTHEEPDENGYYYTAYALSFFLSESDSYIQLEESQLDNKFSIRLVKNQ